MVDVVEVEWLSNLIGNIFTLLALLLELALLELWVLLDWLAGFVIDSRIYNYVTEEET